MNNEKNYAAYIHVDGPDSIVHITVIDLTAQKEIAELYELIPPKDAKQFVNDIPSKFGNFKSIILSVCGFHSNDYKNNLEFRNAIRAKLELINARYHFIKDGIMVFSIPVYAANITVNIGENVVTAILEDSTFQVLNFEFTENGYLLSGRQAVPYRVNDNVNSIREKITAKFNPKELIIVAGGNDLTKLEKMNDVHVINSRCWSLARYTIQLITDYSKWLVDQSSVRTLLLPSISNRYSFMKYMGDKLHGEDLTHDGTDVIPFTKTIFLPKSKCTYAVLCNDRHSEKPTILFGTVQKDDGNIGIFHGSAFPKPLVEQISKNDKYHGIKFTVEIDVNNFPTFTFRPMILKGIRTLPQTLDDKKAEIPIIGFFGDLSVICLRRNCSNYEFLKDWGGMYGSELSISFDEEKVKYGEAASAMIETKPTFTVYDVLKIMSMPATKIDIDETWHFGITKDSDNPVLLEFDTFDGTKKAASSQFLMALLLKQHLQAIRNEIGEKPKKVGFCFFKVDDSVKERLKNQICESFGLLKIEHEFIDI